MRDKEQKLSDYIDCLNEERKPEEHGSQIETPEIEELFDTVRMVRSLKEPAFPEDGFTKKLAESVNEELLKEKHLKKPKKRWFYGIASAAAAVALIIGLNTVMPVNKNNMVYAVEKAFKDVKAYHGVLEVLETNALGESTAQSKVEVWADKEGRYYVKGLEGSQKNLITVNDGKRKWQVQPKEKEVEIFTAFPDPYSFTFEIGKEIEDMKNAIKTQVIGDDTVAGRAASIIEVTPQGGEPYKIWIDKDTKMPLQKQSAMEYSLQYIVRYTDIDFEEAVPKELLSYSVPKGFKEINTNPEQVVNSLEEAKEIAGFTPKIIENVPESFAQDNISVINDKKVVKINYVSKDNKKNIVILEKKSTEKFKPASMAVLGKINNNAAEIQSPIESQEGVLQGGGAYSGVTDITSVRWQENGFEYAVVGNTSLEELTLFIKGLTNGTIELSSQEKAVDEPQVKVPVDLEIEKAEQKNVDAGHSPWKLDPAFVSQVFVSLKISPEGIVGDYPIKYEEFKVIKNTGKKAVVEVSGDRTPIRKVYLERLIRQDSTGIWTVVGYDPK
ncbi:LolA family protein [Clostridium sp.]|uniref:LolA family protein n=1 Tax=Clostridium sp. TaxID=1506 RepID=UPI0039F491BA